MADSLEWTDGERDRFRAALSPEDMRYYVDAAYVAPFKETPSKIADARWRELGAKGGYHIHVLVEHGPPAIAVEAIASQLAGSDSIFPLAGALAVLGEPVIPSAIQTLERAVGNIGNGVYAKQIELAIADIQPIRSTRIAELVLAALASKAKPKVKESARAWIARHPEVAAPVIEKAKTDPALKTAAKAAAKLLA